MRRRTRLLFLASLIPIGCSTSSSDSPTSQGNATGATTSEILMPLADGATAEEVRAALKKLGKTARYRTGRLTVNIPHEWLDIATIQVDQKSGAVRPGQVSFAFGQSGETLSENALDDIAEALGKAGPMFRPVNKIVEDKIAGIYRYEFGAGAQGPIASLDPRGLNICTLLEGPACVAAVRAAIEAKYPQKAK